MAKRLLHYHTKGAPSGFRNGFTMVELALVLLIIGILTVGIYFSVGSEIPKTVIQTQQKECETIISKVKETGQTRTQKFAGLDAAGLDNYGLALPYSIDIANNYIVSQAAGGCYYTVTPSASGYTFDFSANCDNASAWSAGAATGVNKKVKDFFVQSMTDRITTAFGTGLTVTSDKSSGKLSVTFSGIQ